MDFKSIFNTYKKDVLSLCFRYLQQEQEAEDAAQDIFVKVYQKMGSFREEAQIGTWIYRISVNHCLDILKAQKRKKKWLQIVAFLPFISETNADRSPNNPIENKEASRLLQEKLLKLPEKQLTALVLNKLESLPIEKVAQIMNLSYKAVESLLQRAKQNLHKQLNNSKD